MNKKLSKLTISEAREGINEKKFSPQELVQAHLNQIKKHNSKLNALLTVVDNPKIDPTKKDQPLYGIPFTMKDVYMTKGIKTTASSKVLENHVAGYNATVYQRLIDAGAVLVGKSNCDAWGHGASTENSHFGPTKNPWNSDYVPGGSSGGSGTSLAANFSIFDIGEDTGGSIRLPASFCSVVGLKVTYGLVSRYGSIAYASSLDTVGPMAKSVEDCALVLEIIAGNDPLDATSTKKRLPEYSKHLDGDISGLKIGLPREYFGEGLDNKVKEKIDKAVVKLTKIGCEFSKISLPMTKYAVATYYLIATSETSSNLARYDGIRYGSDRSAFGAEAKRRIMLGTFTLSAGYYDDYYLKATKMRTLIKKDFDQAFENIDLILAPTYPSLPFKLGEKVDDPLQMYLSDVFTIPVNLAGIPSLAVPCGFSEGLPVGMQIIGPAYSEAKLFNFGHQYEQAVGGFKTSASALE